MRSSAETARVIRAPALLAAVVFTAAAAPVTHHQGAASRATVRVQIVSGNGQTARAFAATNAPKYITDFPRLLVVRVSGPTPNVEARLVRFHCVTKGCALAPADQPENGIHVDRVDTATYKAHVVHGKASLHVSVQADRPDAAYTVEATPVVSAGERAISASFTLISN